jgi:hypothetical protein
MTARWLLCLALVVSCARKNGEPVKQDVVKVIGIVTESFVDDVSKQAGKRVPVCHLSVKVERTEPPDAIAALSPNQRFRAGLPSPFAAVEFPIGTRVEVTTTVSGAQAGEERVLTVEHVAKVP